jgi:hypothetical protein
MQGIGVRIPVILLIHLKDKIIAAKLFDKKKNSSIKRLVVFVLRGIEIIESFVIR